MRSFYRTLRIFSAITLFFFCWTFLPLWQAVAYAAEKKQERGATANGGTSPTRSQTSGERFENALEGIREKVGIAEKKSAKGEDDAAELADIKTKKAEIESIDVELRNEFSVTEKKLKDAKLPQEILDRHAKFVKNYESNLAELKANLDDVEKAATKADRSAKMQKVKAHLEKVKAPSRHQKLDPGNLPFRARKAGNAREPRLKKEEFEKDFPTQRLQRSSRIAELQRLLHASRLSPQSSLVLLAYNDIASDIPFQLPRPSENNVSRPLGGDGWGEGLTPQTAVRNSQLDTMTLAAASSNDLPTADDLAETPEVQFTNDIKDKAQELGHNPVKIYNWVRNNIEYVPTYGSIQGAQMTLETKMGNDFDTASLLIALLRASGISSRYVYGTVDIPIEKAMNWVGGVTDPKMVGTIFATNGVPATLLKTSGNVYKYTRIEHVWVDAYVDYIPSRGAVHKQGDTWISLDPSYKQYKCTEGTDIRTTVPFDAQAFANQLLTTITTTTADGSITNLNSTLFAQTNQDYQTQVQNYIQQNYPNTSVEDFIGKKEIIQQNYPILVGTLPYNTVQAGTEFAKVPDNLQEMVSFNIPDPSGKSAGLIYTTSLAQIAGKKITLSFSPSTESDESIINSLLPQPHSDGTPLQPSDLPTSFPAYLINLTPELRIDSQIVATGATAIMGSERAFTMVLSEPGIGLNNFEYILKVGQYSGICLDAGKIGTEYISKLKSKLEVTKIKLEANNYNDITKEEIVGDLFYTVIATYFAALDTVDNMEAHMLNVIRYRAPSLGTFSLSLNVHQLFGLPLRVDSNSMVMDVKGIVQSVFSKDSSLNNKVKQFMLLSGINSSVQEHSIPEKLFANPDGSTKGISAVKAIQIANEQGIPIYTISKENSAALLPQLQVSEAVMSDITNAINAGKEVTVSKTNITFNGWEGCGYIILDTITGVGAYMIAGNNNGAWCGCAAGGTTICEVIGILLAAVIVVPIAIVLSLVLTAIFVIILYWVLLVIMEIIPALLTLATFLALVGGLYYFAYCMENLPFSPPGPDTSTTLTALCAAILTYILLNPIR